VWFQNVEIHCIGRRWISKVKLTLLSPISCVNLACSCTISSGTLASHAQTSKEGTLSHFQPWTLGKEEEGVRAGTWGEQECKSTYFCAILVECWLKMHHTASISQCFMTKHCKKIKERDTLLFTILFNKKKQILYSITFVIFVWRHDLRSFLMLGL